MAPTVANPLEELTLPQLRERTSLKWRRHPADVLPLWIAEMDVLLAEPIVRAVTDAVRRGDTGYPAGTAYAQAFEEFAARRWGWAGVAVERTALVSDVMTGVVEILRLVTKPRSAVVINCPVYPPFYAFVENMDRRIVEAPLGAGGRLDLDTLAQAFGEATFGGKPAAYLLCSPHNPTGTVHTLDELTDVARLANEYGVRVVVDEIHGPLVLPGARFVPYLSVPNGENAFSLVSASKAWNLAGLKAALAVAGPAAAIDLARLPEVVSHGPSHVGSIAHTAALRDGGQWLDALLAGLDDNRQLLATLLKRHLPRVRHIPPQATYLAWLDCREVEVDSGVADPQKRGLVTSSAGHASIFLDRARVALTAGPAFGSGGAGHVRLNFATSREILTEAVRRMGDSVNGAGS